MFFSSLIKVNFCWKLFTINRVEGRTQSQDYRMSRFVSRQGTCTAADASLWTGVAWTACTVVTVWTQQPRRRWGGSCCEDQNFLRDVADLKGAGIVVQVPLKAQVLHCLGDLCWRLERPTGFCVEGGAG